jgi:hypothetical protein
MAAPVLAAAKALGLHLALQQHFTGGRGEGCKESLVFLLAFLVRRLFSCCPSKGPPPRGLSGTGIDGWLGGDFDRLHT